MFRVGPANLKLVVLIINVNYENFNEGFTVIS